MVRISWFRIFGRRFGGGTDAGLPIDFAGDGISPVSTGAPPQASLFSLDPVG
jgi:hypothetical protein